MSENERTAGDVIAHEVDEALTTAEQSVEFHREAASDAVVSAAEAADHASRAADNARALEEELKHREAERVQDHDEWRASTQSRIDEIWTTMQELRSDLAVASSAILTMLPTPEAMKEVEQSEEPEDTLVDPADSISQSQENPEGAEPPSVPDLPPLRRSRAPLRRV